MVWEELVRVLLPAHYVMIQKYKKDFLMASFGLRSADMPRIDPQDARLGECTWWYYH